MMTTRKPDTCPVCRKRPTMITGIRDGIPETDSRYISVRLRCELCDTTFRQTYPYTGLDEEIPRAEEACIESWNYWSGKISFDKIKYLSQNWDVIKLRDALTGLGIQWYDDSRWSDYELDKGKVLVMLRTSWMLDGEKVSVIWGYYAGVKGYADEKHGVTMGFPENMEILYKPLDEDPMEIKLQDIIDYFMQDSEQAKKFVPYYQRED